MEENRRNILRDILYGNRITSVIRILLGIMFLFSGYFKILDLDSFSKVIVLYDIIPEFLAAYPAIIMPFLEVILGLFLVFGYKVRASAFLSAGLMLMFAVFIAINVARGKNFDCGCFELGRLGIGINENVSIGLVIRDLVLLLCFAVLFRVREHVWSIQDIFDRVRLRNL